MLPATWMGVFAWALLGCATTPPAGSPPAPAAAARTDGAFAPRVNVKVTDAGFVPARIPARRGVPLTLVITREVGKTCATEIQFEGQPGTTELPIGKAVEVTFTPGRTGEVKFGCAMGMMIGGVLAVVE